MGRWEPGSKGRLQEAALELFAERGFEQTTAAQIAAQAGVTERTFFRHFADKREVFFAGFPLLQERLESAVEQAPRECGALDAVGHGMLALAGLIGEGRPDLAAKRQAVVAATPELRERELAKFADFAAVTAELLRRRGVGDPQAELAAQMGMTALRVAAGQWTDAGQRLGLVALVERSIADLRAVAGEG